MHHPLLRPSDTPHLLLEVGGSLRMTLGGVLLFIDTDDEEQYVETEPGFQMEALIALGNTARQLGFEPLDEWESSPEEFPDGRVRHWLAQIVLPEGGETSGTLHTLKKEVAEVA